MQTQAKICVNKARPKWIRWERDYEEEEETNFLWICCGYLTKEHLEAFIFWAITCWAGSRRKAGRGDISYRKYKPLRSDAALQEEEQAAEQKHLQEQQQRVESGVDSNWISNTKNHTQWQ